MEIFWQFVVNHWALWLGLVVVVALIIQHETSQYAGGVKLVNCHEMTQLLNHEKGVLVDLRSEETFNKGHIPSATNIPGENMVNNLKKLPKQKSRPLILVCQRGQSAPRYASSLRAEGFENLFCLRGGIQSWEEQQLPLVTNT